MPAATQSRIQSNCGGALALLRFACRDDIEEAAQNNHCVTVSLVQLSGALSVASGVEVCGGAV